MGEQAPKPVQNRKSPTSEDEVKNENLLNQHSIPLGQKRKEPQTECQSCEIQNDDPAGLQDSQNFLHYIDSRFKKHQFHPLEEHGDLTFVKTGTINLPVKALEFFRRCLSKDADLSAQVFMKNRHECSKIKLGTWCKDHHNTDQPQTYVRVIKFKVKVPFAIPIPFFPKDINICNEQRFRFFGPECLFIDEILEAPEVPFGNSGKVVQTWKVIDTESSAGCQVSIQHACRWSKKSLFNGMLEKLVKKGLNIWFSGWTKWLKRNLDERQNEKRLRESGDDETNSRKKRKLH